MANLNSIAELFWRQMYPNPTDEVSISLEEIIETAKGEYSYQYLLLYWKEKREEGSFNMPANLATEKEFDVINNEIDISALEIMSRLPYDQWLVNIGGLTCECKYIKSNINQAQLLCNDDSMPDDYKPYLIIGNRIKFPKGTHANKITMIYANNGLGTDGNVEIADELAALVRRGLVEIYLGKINKEDKTNNSNSDN